MPRPRKQLRAAALLIVAIGLLGLSGPAVQAAIHKPGAWVDLATGRVGPYQWSVKAHPHGGAIASSQAAERPCLSVSALWRLGPYSYHRTRYRQCASAAQRLVATGAPLIASAGQPSDRPSPEITAVGMIFAPAVRRVQITLAGGRTRTVRLTELSPAKARTAGLRRFRYGGFVVPGAWCAERIVSQSASGKTLWDSGTDEYSCRRGS